MFRAMELAAAFFEDQYASPAGAAARAYVEKRGIGAAVRERFRVGYAPGALGRAVVAPRGAQDPGRRISSGWGWSASTSAAATTSFATA